MTALDAQTKFNANEIHILSLYLILAFFYKKNAKVVRTICDYLSQRYSNKLKTM